jgi:hypothetical protein
MSTKLENKYQSELRERIMAIFPDAQILKNDSAYLTGVPDLTILHRNKWAWLEVKREPPGPNDFRPNQEYYVAWAAERSFGATVFPQNENEVLRALVEYFN